ncbi:MAG: hypothetical protein GKR96_12035 [Gammaproteobacteria bacterium]|nr:hypothetical protein [Gammaproteobacteria bacterium]
MLRNITLDNVILGIRALVMEILSVYWTLVKIMVPVLIAVKLLDHLGATQVIADLFEPIMSLVGLPETMGLVLATAMLTNMYTAMVVFLSFTGTTPLSVAEVTVLGSMMLLSHSIPIEGTIAKTVGLPWSATILLRVGGAFLLGFGLHWMYKITHTMQSPAIIVWHPAPTDDSLSAWAFSQIETLLGLLLILVFLMSLLKLLKQVGAEKWIHWALAPLLRLLGIGKEATNIIVIGAMLGLSFGGGLLIQEAKRSTISKRDIMLSIAFIGICHGLIDDTIVMLLLGADITGVLWIRIIFAVLIMAIIARLPIVKQRLG